MEIIPHFLLLTSSVQGAACLAASLSLSAPQDFRDRTFFPSLPLLQAKGAGRSVLRVTCGNRLRPLGRVEVEQQDRQVRGTDAADPARLANARGSNTRQLLARLRPELRDGAVVEVHRDRPRFQAMKAFYLGGLAIDIAGVLGL